MKYKHEPSLVKRPRNEDATAQDDHEEVPVVTEENFPALLSAMANDIRHIKGKVDDVKDKVEFLWNER